MAFTKLFSTSKASANATSVTTNAVDSSGCNLIVIAAADYGATTSTLTDSKSNTWSGLTAQVATGRIKLFYVYAPTVGASHTFTYTSDSGVSYPSLAVIGFSGSASSPFDQQNGSNTFLATSLATGSVTPTQDNELVIAGLEEANALGTVTIDSGFTMEQQVAYSGGNNFGVDMAFKIQTSAAAVNPTFSWTNASTAAAAIATFKAAAATAKLRRNSSLNGLGASGPFFHDPLAMVMIP